ncbi:pectinesterase family protein [uncultured Proteiniphilum sp.]|uniref:pectinesterase family protein n=1 Tax=uncultured Proteiniphilum sp. TaxID=497637 RepID=UPI003450CB22
MPWRKPENKKTARYSEYNNSGTGSDTAQRVKWMKILTLKERQRIIPKNVRRKFYEKSRLPFCEEKF